MPGGFTTIKTRISNDWFLPSADRVNVT